MDLSRGSASIFDSRRCGDWTASLLLFVTSNGKEGRKEKGGNGSKRKITEKRKVERKRERTKACRREDGGMKKGMQ